MKASTEGLGFDQDSGSQPVIYDYKVRGLQPATWGLMACTALLGILLWITISRNANPPGHITGGDVAGIVIFVCLIFVEARPVRMLLQYRNASIIFDGTQLIETDLWGREKPPILLHEIERVRRRWRWPFYTEQEYVVESHGLTIQVGDSINGFKHLLMTLNSELVRKGMEPITHQWINPGQ